MRSQKVVSHHTFAPAVVHVGVQPLDHLVEMLSSHESFGFWIVPFDGTSGRNLLAKGARQVRGQHEHARLQVAVPFFQAICAGFIAAFSAGTGKTSYLLFIETEAAHTRQITADHVGSHFFYQFGCI